MSETAIRELHADIEAIKQDIAEIKAALLDDEGELSDWAKARLDKYLKHGPKGFVSQEEVEKEFL